ncbi:hypothetical protein LSH36_87g04032 [Paralvinella palmiformis]|uniref:Uncharacterized protein n=1 Tax=Paralvinella palmiformis TaxID=53620 RepID=A0AAD9K154_9ANNE|nr:hypothetical protein LSH36_87g04032 [Paralvinella palmiformis]
MKLFLPLFVILPLAAWGAPTLTEKNDQISDDSLKPLIRTKRADEEIIFGNHQNEARVVKKSDPSLNLDDEVIDNDVNNSDDVSTKPDDESVVSSVINDVSKPESDHLIEEEESSEKNDEDSSSLSEAEAEEFESSSGEEDDDILNNKGTSLTAEENINDFYPYVGFTPYLRSKPKQKRAAPGKFLTAENMPSAVGMSGPNASQRHKRDLTAEELYDWLQNGNKRDDLDRYGDADDDVRYYRENDDERDDDDDDNDDVVEDGEVPEDDEIKELALELLEQEYPDQTDNNLDYPAYQDYGDDEMDRNKEMLSLLDYLEKGTPVLERAPLRELYPEHIQEEWDDLETGPEQFYEPIVYHGVPGIFVPMPEESLSENTPIQKRQYLSLLPGQKKRNFYPYHLEPTGGRWGAFVSPEEEKRNSESYDRLYRLAQALNPRNRDYIEYK